MEQKYEFRKTRIVKSEVMEIGPAEAMSMLEKNIDNRKIKPHIVLNYAKQMQNGLWRENGETLLMTKSGKLLNGQHRLSAIVTAGTFRGRFLVATAEEADGEGELTPLGLIQDRGTIRTHTDISGISKFADSTAAALLLNFTVNGFNLSRDTVERTRMYEAFAEHIDYLGDKCSTAARYYSKSIIRAVFVLRLSQGYDYSDYYRSILTDLVDLPRAWMAWYKKIGTIKHHDIDGRREIISSTWALTDPDRDLDRGLYPGNSKANVNAAKAQLIRHLSENRINFK